MGHIWPTNLDKLIDYLNIVSFFRDQTKNSAHEIFLWIDLLTC